MLRLEWFLLKYIFFLYHSRLTDKAINAYDTKKIGFFSSLEKAQEIIEQYKCVQGFKDYPDCFKIEKLEINYDDFDFQEGD